MCKLLAILDIENQENAEIFAAGAVPYMTAEDDDGLGIMRLGDTGLQIERYLETPTVWGVEPLGTLAPYALALKPDTNESGIKPAALYALAVHARFATCEVNLENVHPFAADGTAIMHNGVINNAAEFPRSLSTCDSEVILWRYRMNFGADLRQTVERTIDGMGGYYACIAFNAGGTVDIWRDATATLYMAHVEKVGTVIGTSKEIIETTASDLKLGISSVREILPYTAIRWEKGKAPIVDSFTAIKPAPKVVTYQPDQLTKEFQMVTTSERDHWWNQKDSWTETKIETESERVNRLAVMKDRLKVKWGNV